VTIERCRYLPEDATEIRSGWILILDSLKSCLEIGKGPDFRRLIRRLCIGWFHPPPISR
jgi:hypothetical protein